MPNGVWLGQEVVHIWIYFHHRQGVLVPQVVRTDFDSFIINKNCLIGQLIEQLQTYKSWKEQELWWRSSFPFIPKPNTIRIANLRRLPNYSPYHTLCKLSTIPIYSIFEVQNTKIFFNLEEKWIKKTQRNNCKKANGDLSTYRCQCEKPSKPLFAFGEEIKP